MGLQQIPSKGGIPSGNTASRPGSPVIGDTYYNGTLEVLEIYNGTTWVAVSAPPATPTITSVTDVGTDLAYATGGSLTVVFTPGSGGGTANQYNAYTTAGGFTASSSSASVTLTGLTPATAFTVYGTAQNNFGVTVNSANASPVTVTTKPQAPTIGTTTLSGGIPVVNWTLNATGGKNLSSITITPYLNGTTAQTAQNAATTSSTSHTFTGLTEGASYTFKVSTTNANGTSLDSSASNSVTVDAEFTVDYLVIAGGGGGGGNAAGGAGAGGYRTSAGTSGANSSAESSFTATLLTNYTVQVGAGGSGDTGSDQGTNGTNSVFSTVTSTGGGGGGGASTKPGLSGGSGGGGAYTGSAAGGTGTANQGRDGGNSVSSGVSGGGGGGASAVGSTGSGTSGVAGGAGLASDITGSSVTRAGGGGSGGDGGGGTGGTGGGGDGGGGGGAGGAAGTVNTGSGGGGGGGTGGNGGTGGSGVVILRYPDTKTITIGAGLTGSESSASGGFKRATITAGSGNVSWA